MTATVCCHATQVEDMHASVVEQYMVATDYHAAVLIASVHSGCRIGINERESIACDVIKASSITIQ